MDESEFEISQIPAKSAAVAIDKKHAYKTVVINPSISEEPSVSEVIKPERDRINNLTQKEKNMERVGLTRKLPYQRIVDALNAVKKVEYRDASGNVKYRDEPDFDKNKWGTEMALKAFGDLIERKEVEYEIGDKTLDRYKAMTVGEMKARMADILLGKDTKRLPAIDVEGDGRT